MADTGLLVKFELLGREETSVSAWSIDSNYLTSTDGFEFTLEHTDRERLFPLELEPVELVVNGASQGFGRIDITEIGDQANAITCRGRDYIADLVECNVDPTVNLTEGMSLERALLLIFGPCGIAQIQDDADVDIGSVRSGKRRSTSGKRRRKANTLRDLKPRVGEGMYEFANRFVARQGATIQPGTSRDMIVLSTPSYTQAPLYPLRCTADRTRAAQNNVLTAKAVRDYSRFPTFTIAHGKNGRTGDKQSGGHRSYDMATVARAFGGELSERLNAALIATGRIKPQGATLLPPLLYRFLHIEDDDARTDTELDEAAKRAIAERLKDTLSYTATVKGHSDPETGAIWAVDTIVDVKDEIRRVNEPLWIAERRFSYSKTEGATTQLTCWRPDSFQIGN